jgi:predicted HAD superfamily Cof-like phosphohydrolase
MSIAAMVREFHETYGIPIRNKPTMNIREIKLRIDILEEEWEEYVTACIQRDLVEVADALADMVYVIYGTALAHGIDLDAVLAEVHRSNMSKLGADGKPIRRDDGKVMKGPAFSPPNIAGLLGGVA